MIPLAGAAGLSAVVAHSVQKGVRFANGFTGSWLQGG